jgi:hypothetical protein
MVLLAFRREGRLASPYRTSFDTATTSAANQTRLLPAKPICQVRLVVNGRFVGNVFSISELVWERQVRQIQFTALIERRDGAARSLLHADTTGRCHKPGYRPRSWAARSLRGEPSVLFQLADALQVFVTDAAHAAPAGAPSARPFHLVGMELGAVSTLYPRHIKPE